MARFSAKLKLGSCAGLAAFIVALSPAQAATNCADLANLKIAPSEIALTSSGATINSAQVQMIAADPKTPDMKKEYCKVLGAIHPVDPTAPDINFEVNLPTDWNGKGLQYGGGGSNGVLTSGLGPLRDARNDTPVPVARGYATWGTDAGHQNAKLGGENYAFALNNESFVNMAYASYKKTHDTALRVVNAFYGKAPTKTYFYGGSEGGREALLMAQRYPQDFDGIVGIVPVLNYVGLNLVRSKLLTFQSDGGWINQAKAKTINTAVNAACDKLDGLEDGVISQYEKCLSVFDVKKLRCPDGKDTGDTCLSDAQIQADLMAHSPQKYPFALANGITSFPGWNYGSELQPGGMIDSVTGTAPPSFPTEKSPSANWTYNNGYVRFYLAKDAKYNPLQFTPANYEARLKEISTMFDMTNPDLSAFLARGGKLIMRGNGADYQRSIMQEITYYKAVVAKMGQANADKFIRFFVTPGVNHPGDGVEADGSVVPDGVDMLGMLDGWVETGNAPAQIVQVSQEEKAPFKTIASRPMCLYPAYPHYNGKGDAKDAASFTCMKQ